MGGKVVHMIKRWRLASFTQITLKGLGACRGEPVVHQWFERIGDEKLLSTAFCRCRFQVQLIEI